MKSVRGFIEKKLGGPCNIARMLGFKNHQKVSHWFSAERIPYQFAIIIAVLTGIRIEKIAPYAKRANEIISDFLFNKSLSQFDNKKADKITIESTSKFGDQIIIMDDNFLISGYKKFKKMMQGETGPRHIISLQLNQILRGELNLDILNFSNIEKLLIANYLKKVLKGSPVYTNDTAAKIIWDIIQIKFEDLADFNYLTKHACKKVISFVDSGAITLSEAYSLVKESEFQHKSEEINRQKYAEPCPQSSTKKIQNIILHTEFGCAI